VRLTLKVLLLLLLVAVPPAALSGWVSLELGGKAIEDRVLDAQRRAAAQSADLVERFLSDATRDLKRISEYVPFERFPADELSSALRIPYQQLAWTTAVALLDASGEPLTAPVHRAPGDAGAAEREVVDPVHLEAFSRHIPAAAALQRGSATSTPYLSAEGSPRLAIAQAFSVASGRQRWVLAAEISLRGATDKLLSLAPGATGVAYLVDSTGALLFHPRADWVRARHTAARLAPVRDGLEGRKSGGARYHALDVHEVVGAFAPVAALRGGVVVEQRVDEAFAAIRRLRNAALGWTALSLGLALFGAMVLARGVTAPVRELADAASNVAQGHYDRRLPVRSRDELSQLAETFNRMSDEVRAKQDEITVWNKDLAARVEERTRELHEARDQVVRSEKLAATAELASGVAHELNNPLTGILGLSQVLRETSTNGVREYLDEIVTQAERMRTIIRNMMRLAQSSGGARRPVDLARLIEDAVLINREKLEKQRIHVEVDGEPDLLDVEGSASDLLLAVMHLTANAMHAMPKGGTITFQTRVVDHAAVKLVVRDTGVGIDEERLSRIFEPFYTDRTAGQDRSGGGLGLSVAHRIVEEHHGRIVVASTPGAGTSFTLFFPGLRKELHLR